MNIIFFGSSEFAAPSLGALIQNGCTLSCVITQPDKVKGRHLRLGETAVKNLAARFGLKIYQPQDINAERATEFLRNLSPDLFVVISYGQILSPEVLEIPKILSINIHASLLPKYRGAAPINWAIIKGENETGVTVMKMEREMDSGPIINQEVSPISDKDTAVSLAEKLAISGSRVLLESIEKIKKNNYKLIPQEEGKVTFAPKLKKGDGLIAWNQPAIQIHNLVRGCLPWPGAFTYYKGKILKLFQTQILTSSKRQRPAPGGTIKGIYNNQIVVATKDDDLIIQELQLEGKRRMTARDFLAGHRIKPGEALEKKSIA